MTASIRSVVCLIDMAYVLLSASIFVRIKFNFWKILFYITVIGAVNILLHLYIEEYYILSPSLTLYLRLMATFGYAAVICKLFEVPLFRTMGGVALFFTADAIYGQVALTGFFSVYGVNYIKLFKNSILLQLIGFMAVKAFDWFTIIGLIRLFKRNRDSVSSNKKYDLTLGFYSASTMSIMIINIAIAQAGRLSLVEMVVTEFTSCFFLLMNVVFIYFITRFAKKEKELAFHELDNKSLNSIIGQLSESKHNFDNILATISGYIEFGEWEGLKGYVNEMKQKQTTIGLLNIAMLKQIKEPGIIGLVLSKLERMRNSDIYCSVIVNGNIDIQGIKISDLCDCLGILMDNALEAASETDHGVVKITIQMTEGGLVFGIENTVNGPVTIDRMFEKGWSTKGEGRGLGLWYAMNIIKSYRNVFLNTSFKEGVLYQELIISA